MLENTNKAIAYNSIILYIRTIINTICALFTTRFALQALGIVDYGLYAVLGGIISFISIFNTIMLSTSNRFIAVAIGKGDRNEINKQFNVNFVIHFAIALFALIIAIPVGNWYIARYVNYEGPLSNALLVYYITIIGSVVSFIGVPYNGLLMAKEKFIIFSSADVVSHIIKLIIAWLLINHFENKLIVYTCTMSILYALPTLYYIIYCSIKFPEIVRFHLVRDRLLYKKVFKFSAWVSIGAFAYVGKQEGAALVVNTFFNTVMNTAMGIASSVAAYVSLFAQNVIQPMAPQITKSYAAGNKQRTDELLVMSTKYSFLLTFLVGSVFLISPEWLLSLWLGSAPPFASVFLILLVVDNLVISLNAGIQNIVFASGNLKLYQLIVSALNILSIIIGYFVLKGGAPAYYLSIVYIFVSIIKFFAIQWILHITLHYDNRLLWKNSYIPSLLVVVLFVPILFLPNSILPIIKLVGSFTYVCVLEWFVGLTQSERKRFLGFLLEKLHK